MNLLLKALYKATETKLILNYFAFQLVVVLRNQGLDQVRHHLKVLQAQIKTMKGKVEVEAGAEVEVGVLVAVVVVQAVEAEAVVEAVCNIRLINVFL